MAPSVFNKMYEAQGDITKSGLWCIGSGYPTLTLPRSVSLGTDIYKRRCAASAGTGRMEPMEPSRSPGKSQDNSRGPGDRLKAERKA